VPRALTKEEREQLLAELHVGVVTIADGDRGPLTCPVWYTYQPGGVIAFCTKKEARKLRLFREGARVSFLVQVEGDLTSGVLPKYVAVEGPVVKLGTAHMERDLRPIMHRYLGPAVADAYLQSTRGDSAEGDVVVQIKPERWLTRAFGV
jgi:nitroimidazol reductase NimA-like FMN-containing flavoprotein (pyridoxamine 5'-phosphate oxidase superfamily)